MNDALKNLQTIEGQKIIGFVGILDDDSPNICLDCGHSSKTHAEFEVEGYEEAEVVCPNCGSSHYFVA